MPSDRRSAIWPATMAGTDQPGTGHGRVADPDHLGDVEARRERTQQRHGPRRGTAPRPRDRPGQKPVEDHHSSTPRARARHHTDTRALSRRRGDPPRTSVAQRPHRRRRGRATIDTQDPPRGVSASPVRHARLVPWQRTRRPILAETVAHPARDRAGAGTTAWPTSITGEAPIAASADRRSAPGSDAAHASPCACRGLVAALDCLWGPVSTSRVRTVVERGSARKHRAGQPYRTHPVLDVLLPRSRRTSGGPRRGPEPRDEGTGQHAPCRLGKPDGSAGVCPNQ